MSLDGALVQRLFAQAGGARWALPPERFAEALETSVRRAFAGGEPPQRALRRYLDGLHLADLALACACAHGHEGAWDQFVCEHRPILYRAADAMDRSGAARELADALYADLYGFADADGTRRSLFRYFHGRSSLATWLRAVLAQRHIDALRVGRRTEPLPDDDRAAPAVPPTQPDPDRSRLPALVHAALRTSIAGLVARDRLRLRSYYAAGLTLAQIGRLTGEHEATVSRHLGRTRRLLREATERQLREGSGLSRAEIERGIELAVEPDADDLDLQQMFGASAERKNAPPDRST